MRHAVLSGLVGLLGACSACYSAIPPSRSVTETYDAAVTVEVSCPDVLPGLKGSGGGAYGSAVLLDDHRALTAFHVVDPVRCTGGLPKIELIWNEADGGARVVVELSLIHISEPTRLLSI